MSWYLETPTHWILVETISVVLGVATFKLHGDTLTHTGKARKGLYGWLVVA
jgi:hypothetical protein